MEKLRTRDRATLEVRAITPDDKGALAETAATVIDEWQGRGVGTELLRRVAARAREAGIEHFTASCLAENHDIQQLLQELGP